jgi:hypothetical protein
MKIFKNRFGQLVVLAVASIGSAFAAVDVAITTALTTAGTDAATVGAAVTVVIAGIFAIKLVRRAL